MTTKDNFFVKQVRGRGPELREPNKAVLCPLIIIILISNYDILWSDRYFASQVGIHSTQCHGANPPKLEMIRSSVPPF